MKKLYFLILFVLGSHSLFAQTIRYVKQVATGSEDGSTWANASGDLQAMINASAAGDEVWVASGIYYPTLAQGSLTTNRDKTFLLKTGVSIYGGFTSGAASLSGRNLAEDATVLSGDLDVQGDKTDNAYHVVVATGDLTGARLDGFTVTLGYANGSATSTINGASVHQGRAGGLFLGSTTGAVFENLIIKDNENATSGQNGGAAYFLYGTGTFNKVKFNNNKSSGNGGAVFMLGQSANYIYPSFIDVEFKNNTAAGSDGGGAVFLSSYAQPTFTRAIFENNEATSAQGGAISWTVVSAKINCTDVLFTGNKALAGAGGAVYNYGAASVYNSCKFIGNYTSSSGAALYLGGTASSLAAPIITNTIFANNTANNGTYGGAIYNSTNTDGVLTNCTFYNNTNTNVANTNNGGAVAFFTSSTSQKITFQNCIFNENEGDFYVAAANTGATLIVKNSLVQTTVGTADGVNGNIVNPAPTQLFASTTSTDPNFLHLIEGAATQKGDNSLIPSGITTDLAGQPRITHGTVDLGAYEYQGTLPVSLISYTVAKKGSTSVITWKTESEQNNQKFVIERGSSATNFTFFKEVAGAGDSSTPLSYTVTDFTPLAGTNYYRLTQYDKDGTAKVLGVEAVKFDFTAAKTSVYPNPASSFVTVNSNAAEGIVSLNLISLTGKTILTNNYAQLANESVKLELANIPTGTYILWINKGKPNAEKQTLLVVK